MFKDLRQASAPVVVLVALETSISCLGSATSTPTVFDHLSSKKFLTCVGYRAELSDCIKLTIFNYLSSEKFPSADEGLREVYIGYRIRASSEVMFSIVENSLPRQDHLGGTYSDFLKRSSC
ncbi:hypothetical protein RJT34_02855 [Clitoria ternatea]|uniref:Uncharacterized protein n=1 Tax=Clitoria ternatea TaxID=43366 RepID=A0AAN9Q0N5_CLITE